MIIVCKNDEGRSALGSAGRDIRPSTVSAVMALMLTKWMIWVVALGDVMCLRILMGGGDELVDGWWVFGKSENIRIRVKWYGESAMEDSHVLT
jgi:hypothetical protein